MKRLLVRVRSFIRTCLIGGLLVVVPLGLLAAVVVWLYRTITDLIQPLTDEVTARWAIAEYIADAAVVVGIILLCFGIGLAMKTWFGRVVHGRLEGWLTRIAPGYATIKQTVNQLLGRRANPFLAAALCSLDGSPVLVIAFVTDRLPDGGYSVFVPTSPSPMSGNVFFLPASHVRVIAAPVEQVMQTIISCGAGSADLLRIRDRASGGAG